MKKLFQFLLACSFSVALLDAQSQQVYNVPSPEVANLGLFMIEGPWEHYVDGHTFIGDGYVKYNHGSDPYYLHLNYGDGNAHNGVYVLSSKKKWKEKEARENGYEELYTHDL